MLTLTGTNLGFSGGLTVSNGAVNVGNNAAATSLGAVIIGTANSSGPDGHA